MQGWFFALGTQKTSGINSRQVKQPTGVMTFIGLLHITLRLLSVYRWDRYYKDSNGGAQLIWSKRLVTWHILFNLPCYWKKSIPYCNI